MEESILKNRLATIIRQVAGDQITGIATEESSLSSLGIDSIGLITVICIVEDEFGIAIPEQNLFQIVSFQNFVEIVNDKIKKAEK